MSRDPWRRPALIAKSDGKTFEADAVGVTGCSRFGKGAFIAGAFDQRVALTLPIESGTAGVEMKRAFGEHPRLYQPRSVLRAATNLSDIFWWVFRLGW